MIRFGIHTIYIALRFFHELSDHEVLRSVFQPVPGSIKLQAELTLASPPKQANHCFMMRIWRIRPFSNTRNTYVPDA